MSLNIYLVTRKGETDYDQFSGFVVCCESAEVARNLHPGDSDDPLKPNQGLVAYGTWVTPAEVDVKLVGKAVKGAKPGYILSSFHAG